MIIVANAGCNALNIVAQSVNKGNAVSFQNNDQDIRRRYARKRRNVQKCLTEECNGNCNPTVSAGYCFEDWWRLEGHKLWKEFAPDGEKFPDSAPAVVQRKIAERAFLAGLQSKA